MAITKKAIIDSITEILTRFQKTDDWRVDEDWLSYKIDQVRAELIIAQYLKTGVIDYAWLSDVGLLQFHEVSMADNPTIGCLCDCPISKTTIPQTITLQNKDGLSDIGLYSLISPCGKTSYYPSRTSLWRNFPPGHTNNLFSYYARINTTLYVNKRVEQLKFTGILVSPEDGYLVNSAPVPSGSIVKDTTYYVTGAQIVYNNVTYQPCSTFPAFVPNGGSIAVSVYQGSGVVHLYSQVAAYRDTNPYPAGAEMVRQIELEILTKEFGIERQQVADVRNDSKDDASKTA